MADETTTLGDDEIMAPGAEEVTPMTDDADGDDSDTTDGDSDDSDSDADDSDSDDA